MRVGIRLIEYYLPSSCLYNICIFYCHTVQMKIFCKGHAFIANLQVFLFRTLRMEKQSVCIEILTPIAIKNYYCTLTALYFWWLWQNVQLCSFFTENAMRLFEQNMSCDAQAMTKETTNSKRKPLTGEGDVSRRSENMAYWFVFSANNALCVAQLKYFV